MSEEKTVMTAQDTGNPVLDSLINLLASGRSIPKDMEKLHARLLDLAQKEPGGLKRKLTVGP